MSSSVLDASAFLAYLRDEPGALVVENALTQRACISVFNWAEVLSKVADVGAQSLSGGSLRSELCKREDPEALALHLKNEGLLGNSLEIIPLTEEDALVVAQLRPLTKTSGLSLGERACLALGKRLRLPVFTADRTWASLNLAVQVQLIR